MNDIAKSRSAELQAQKRRFRTAVFFSAMPTPRRILLLAVLEHVRDMAVGAWPSEARLARMTGLARRTVGTHIREAEADGWLVRTRRPQRRGRFGGNAYRLIVPRDHGQLLPTVNIQNGIQDDEHRGQLTTEPWATDDIHRGQQLPTNHDKPRTRESEPSAHPRARGAATPRSQAVSTVAVQLVADHVGQDEASQLLAEYRGSPSAKEAKNPDKHFFGFVERRTGQKVTDRNYRAALKRNQEVAAA
jgi:hypothetical protein